MRPGHPGWPPAARVMAACACAAALTGLAWQPVAARAGAPPSFKDVIASLASPDVNERLGALALLREAGYPQAEVPVAALLTDHEPAVQLAAIATEMDCFLADKLITRSHVAFVVEVRHHVDAAAAFSKGPLAVQPQPLPPAVLTGLLTAARAPDEAVATGAVYALGVVGPLATGAARDTLWRQVEPRLLTMIASRAAATRRAGLQVIARLADRYGAGAPIGGSALGDAVIGAMNDPGADVRAAAMAALGALRSGRAVQALTERFHYYRRGRKADAALDALARIAQPASLPLFESLTRSADPDIRAIAVEGVARAGRVGQVDALVRRMRDERNNRVNLALDFAVARTSRATSLAPFVTALASPDLRDAASQDLLELTATGHADAAVWQAALRTAAPAVRPLAVRVLGLAGTAALASALQPLTHVNDETLAASAARAMARLRMVTGD